MGVSVGVRLSLTCDCAIQYQHIVTVSDCDATILSNLRLGEIDLFGYPVAPIVAPVCHLVSVALRAIGTLWRIALSSDCNSILSYI